MVRNRLTLFVKQVHSFPYDGYKIWLGSITVNDIMLLILKLPKVFSSFACPCHFFLDWVLSLEFTGLCLTVCIRFLHFWPVIITIIVPLLPIKYLCYLTFHPLFFADETYAEEAKYWTDFKTFRIPLFSFLWRKDCSFQRIFEAAQWWFGLWSVNKLWQYMFSH